MLKTIRKNKYIKRAFAFFTTVITMLSISCGTVLCFAANGSGNGSGNGGADVGGLVTWGESLIGNIRTIARVIMIGAIVVLGIMCATAGRGWADRLKSGAAGIIIGVAILAFGTDIVTGLIGTN